MDDKVIHYATAKRITTGRISQIVDGDFKSYWVGKLRGMIVSRSDGEYRFDTESDAYAAAHEFRERCREKASRLVPEAGGGEG